MIQVTCLRRLAIFSTSAAVACLVGCASKPAAVIDVPAPTMAIPAVASTGARPVAPSCVSLDQVDSAWTPEDLLSHMLACVGEGDYAQAYDLNTLAGIYENYDIRRTVRSQVGDGFAVLNRLTYSKMNAEQQQDLQRGRDPASSAMLCPKVMRIGAPTYVPLYLTRYHEDPEGRPEMGPPAAHVDMKPVVDSDKMWVESVNPILHCDGH